MDVGRKQQLRMKREGERGKGGERKVRGEARQLVDGERVLKRIRTKVELNWSVNEHGIEMARKGAPGQEVEKGVGGCSWSNQARYQTNKAIVQYRKT